MTEQNDTNNDTQMTAGQRWYVMVHQNPRWIETMLLKDSRGELLKDGAQPLPSYDFFVPYQFLRPSTDDELREDLRSFVFVHVSEQRIHDIGMPVPVPICITIAIPMAMWSPYPIARCNSCARHCRAVS